MASAKILALASASTLLAAISLVSVAQTASNSPFANKKPKAWEQAPAPASTYSYPVQNVPESQQAPNWAYSTQEPSPATPHFQPQYSPQYPPKHKQAQQYQQAPQYVAPNSHQQGYGSTLAGQAPTVPTSQAYRPSTGGTAAGGSYYPGKNPGAPAYQYTPQQAYGAYVQQQAQPAYPAQNGLRGASQPSWADKAGFGNIETSVSGHARVGIAAMDRTNADIESELVADFDLRGEVSAITNGGLEYGAGLRVRAQRDRYRRGFGGLVGDCAAGDPACSNVLVDGTQRSVKGHTSQFYTSGPEDRRESQIALEGAYLFLRSAYGDVVVGRDDGAAYLFSLGAPSLVMVNASNSTVDYTGLDSVKTLNDASGFSEKITYTSPRLLGDNVGAGVQFGVSYALDATACGVDYCVKDNASGLTDPFAPEIEDVIEVALAVDRNFGNGLSAEITGTYARGSEKTGNIAFDNLQTYGAGLELKYGDFVFGTSFLNSNNGFAGAGDYNAYDAGITWKPSNWGFTASYGYADDDIAHLTSNQGVFAVSYDVGKYRLGTGVQYINRDVPGLTPTGRIEQDEEAVALFIEAGIKF